MLGAVLTLLQYNMIKDRKKMFDDAFYDLQAFYSHFPLYT